MIGKLIFRLPEEREDFELAQNGWKYKLIIDELWNKIRKWEKYEDKDSVTIEELRLAIKEIEQEYFD